MPKLTFIGHAAFLLEDDDGNTVAIDPFIKDNPVTDLDIKKLKPNTILLTHAHNDHVGDTVELAENN
ncbi:MAG: MBL fold metallo-hydrolase, partial [Chloroflexia bacterium]|nr:MBL fold metallo-hydrolase [Chloroflexia bacterium]